MGLRIAVLSDARMPTRADGTHGLGRSAYDIAAALVDLGHDVTLYAGADSVFPFGDVHCGEDEIAIANALARAGVDAYDAFLDTGHYHQLSKLRPHWPIVNRMADMECYYQPPNAAVNSAFMLKVYPKAKRVNTGVDVDSIPFFPDQGDYLLFMGGDDPQKGKHIARMIANHIHMPFRDVFNLEGDDKWEAMGRAYALLYPSERRAAPRLPLEAAATGTPTLCLNKDGTTSHVYDGVTGFVCSDFAQMAERVNDIATLDRGKVRAMIAENHSLEQMAQAYAGLLQAVASGVTW